VLIVLKSFVSSFFRPCASAPPSGWGEEKRPLHSPLTQRPAWGSPTLTSLCQTIPFMEKSVCCSDLALVLPLVRQKLSTHESMTTSLLILWIRPFSPFSNTLLVFPLFCFFLRILMRILYIINPAKVWLNDYETIFGEWYVFQFYCPTRFLLGNFFFSFSFFPPGPPSSSFCRRRTKVVDLFCALYKPMAVWLKSSSALSERDPPPFDLIFFK